MIKTRVMLSLLNGAMPADDWLRAAAEEPPVQGKPKACEGCPLRRGGEWEDGARAALDEMSGVERLALRERWGCHEGHRPCAGMQRLVTAADDAA